MASILILIFSITLFSGVAHWLGKELLTKRHLFGYGSGYSRSALRLERNYKIFSLMILLAMLLWAVISGLISLLGSDPF